MRSGWSTAKTSYFAGADSSRTSRVPSGPDQSRTSVTRVGVAAAAASAASRAADASRYAVNLAGRDGMARNLPRPMINISMKL